MSNRKIKAFKDVAFIYHSEEDGCWIAHSLRTDQIGSGIDMGRALADLLRAIDALLELAGEDQTIAYLREAPREIQQRAVSSKRLPQEVYEVAHKIARGEWPAEIDPSFQAKDDDEEFTAEVSEIAR